MSLTGSSTITTAFPPSGVTTTPAITSSGISSGYVYSDWSKKGSSDIRNLVDAMEASTDELIRKKPKELILLTIDEVRG